MQTHRLESTDFTEWLLAHAEWLSLFREARYDTGDLTPPMAADPRLCRLGRVLVAEADRLGDVPEYQDALGAHAQFHRRAAYCLDLLHAGRRRDAFAETESEGEMRRLSRQLVAALQRLKEALPAVTLRSSDRRGISAADNR